MATSPQLLPTEHDSSITGIQYRVQGALVPILHLNLDGQLNVFFEHHILLWKDPQLQIGMRGKGALKRMIAGMPMYITETQSAGEIAFSRDGAGQIFSLHLHPGQTILVREHQFLAATGNLDYSWQRVKGISNMLFGGTGFFVDRFTATQTEGVVWLHGYGNVFEKILEPGEQIDIEPGGWIFRDDSVRMDQTVYGLRTGLMSGIQLIWNRFTGPGRVGSQSMYVHLVSAE